MRRRLSRDFAWRGVAVAGLLFGTADRRERVVPLTITRGQRDAIYQMVLDHLTGIGEVWMAVQHRDLPTARRLGRDFAEELRLLEDLGWTETIDGEMIALTVPPDELMRTLARLHKHAAGALEIYVSRPKDDEALAQRDVLASEALGEILARLAAPMASEEGSR